MSEAIVSVYRAAMGWCWHRVEKGKIVSESHPFYVKRATCLRWAKKLNPGVGQWDIEKDEKDC